MKKLKILLMVMVVLTATLFVGGCNKKEKVIIYTSTEDYNMELLQEKLDEAFPEYEIIIEYMSTSNIASKVIEEGDDTEIDIVYALEYGYLEKIILEERLANIKESYDLSIFEDDTILESTKDYVIPNIRSGGGIIINTHVLGANGLEKPASYQELLDPKYEDLISMPSPKSSGTGYMFLLSLINAMGQEEALAYFDELTDNIIAYTSSGSGPVNALVAREAAVGFGMISQAATKISEGNEELEILFFDEGAPYSLYGSGVVKGKETRESVKKVMDYIYEEYNEIACEKYYPEKLLKNKNYEVENFPSDIVYSDMSNNTLTRKETILGEWSH